jgi:hypothetical protein
MLRDKIYSVQMQQMEHDLEFAAKHKMAVVPISGKNYFLKHDKLLFHF